MWPRAVACWATSLTPGAAARSGPGLPVPCWRKVMRFICVCAATPTWSAERQRAEVRGQQERANLRESHMGHIYQTLSEGNMHFQLISLLRSTWNVRSAFVLAPLTSVKRKKKLLLWLTACWFAMIVNYPVQSLPRQRGFKISKPKYCSLDLENAPKEHFNPTVAGATLYFSFILKLIKADTERKMFKTKQLNAFSLAPFNVSILHWNLMCACQGNHKPVMQLSITSALFCSDVIRIKGAVRQRSLIVM